MSTSSIFVTGLWKTALTSHNIYNSNIHDQNEAFQTTNQLKIGRINSVSTFHYNKVLTGAQVFLW